MSMMDLMRQVVPQGQPQPGPNDPGGPPPDPQSFRELPPRPINPVQPRAPVSGQPSPPPPQGDQGDQGEQGDTEGLGGLYNSATDITSPGPHDQPNDPFTGPGSGRVRQAFYPPPRSRSHSEWGRPYAPVTMAEMYPGLGPGPFLPSPFEMYGVIAGAGRQYQQWGDPMGGMYAGRASGLAMQFAPILDMLSKGAFSRNFNAARLATMRIQREQMQMDLEASILHGNQMQLKYGEIFEEVRRGAITWQDGEQRVRDLAQGDTVLLEMLNAKGLKGVDDMLDYRQSKINAMAASASQLRKSTGGGDTPEELKRWGVAGGEGGEPGGLPGKGGVVEQPSGPKYAGPGVPPVTAAEGSVDADLAKSGLSPQQVQAAHELLNGGAPAGYDKLDATGKIRGPIDQAVEALRARRNAIAQGSGDFESKANAISQQVDPQTAQILRGLRDYSLDPKDYKQGSARGDLTSVVRSMDNSYDEGNFANAHRFQNQDSAEYKVISRAGNLTQSTLTALQDLNAFKENEGIPKKVIDRWLAHNLRPEDARYQKLFDALFDMDQHIQAIASFTGTPRVTLVTEWLKNISDTASPIQIRGAIMQNVRSAYAAINGYQYDWQTMTKRNTPVPGMNPHNYKIFRDLVRMNTDTGEMPSDAQPESQAVSRNPSEANRDLTRTQKLPPLDMPTIWDLDRRAKLMEHDPDPDKRAQAREIRQRIGPVIGLTEPIVGVDDPNATRSGSR